MKGLCYSVLIFTFCSCNYFRVIKILALKENKTVQWHNKNKKVVFIPMSHIAKPAFYESVKKTIDSLKKNGFIVFYEGTKPNTPINDSLIKKNYDWLIKSGFSYYYRGSKNLDSVVQDMYRRKLRKMLGFHLDSSGYVSFIKSNKLLKNMVIQPRYNALGINQRDSLVDVPINELINAYENKYSFIELKQIDFGIQLNSNSGYVRSQKLPGNNVNSILVDYRDQQLAKRIEDSRFNKIAVLYGLQHLKGTFEHLKKNNPGWEKN